MRFFYKHVLQNMFGYISFIQSALGRYFILDNQLMV